MLLSLLILVISLSQELSCVEQLKDSSLLGIKAFERLQFS
ncbi:hypothetical protein LINPERHAP1_LOCUS21442 [Linum perenne]